MASTTSRKTITPVSTAVSNTTTETAFSQYITIPAYELRKGHKLTFGGSWNNTATNSTDTLTVKAYLGTAVANTGILLADSGALDVANGDIGAFFGWAQVLVFGGASTGLIVGGSFTTPKSAGTGKFTSFGATDAQFDLLADQYLCVMATWSVASASNSVKLDSLWCDIQGYV